MALSEESKLFSCPKCGTIGTIFFLKVDGNNIIVKQKCPKHGERSFNIPLLKKDSYIPQFTNGIFRCYKCGQESTVENKKASGPWMLVKCACPTHGNKLPLQRIWSTIYIDISSKEAPKPQTAQPQPIQLDEKKFCPNCGTLMKGVEEICDACGSKIA